jgi:phage terminase Nu1 subunit (DNA packaging protein)
MRSTTTYRHWTAKTYQDIADFFGVKIDSVKRWAAAGMPAKRAPYRLDRIAQWLRKAGPWRDPLGRNVNDADLMLTGPKTPELERYRRIKADREELELQIRRGEVVDRQAVHDYLVHEVGPRHRKAMEQLRAKYGSEAVEICKRAFDEAVEKTAERASLSDESTKDSTSTTRAKR